MKNSYSVSPYGTNYNCVPNVTATHQKTASVPITVLL